MSGFLPVKESGLFIKKNETWQTKYNEYVIFFCFLKLKYQLYFDGSQISC